MTGPAGAASPPRILFILLGSPGGGGGHSVVQEATAMRRMGVEAAVAVREESLGRYLSAYADIPEAPHLFVPFAPGGLAMAAAGFDVAVATIHRSVSMVAEVVQACPWVLPAYYVQDYEPWFHPSGSEARRAAQESYALIPEAVLFAKTDWIREQVERRHGVAVHKVEPSLDHAVYHPRAVRPPPSDPLRVAAMIRPQTPRRGARRTLDLLRRLKAAFGARLTVTTFGCDAAAAARHGLSPDPAFENRGVLTRPEVAALLRDSDAFVDLSDYQAFGRTALEAMASGALAVVPALGGASEFAHDGVNALVVDSRDVDACLVRLLEVLGSPGRFQAMREAALAAAAAFSPERAARSELRVLLPALARLRERAAPPLRPRVVLLPLPGPGGAPPEAALARLLPFRQDGLAARFDVVVAPGGTLPPPGSADLLVIGRGLAPEAWRGFAEWRRAWHEAEGRIVLDLDDPHRLAAWGLAARRQAALADAADLVAVASEEMAAHLSRHRAKIRLVPGHLVEPRRAVLDQALGYPTPGSGAPRG